jgi:hypothetical protein
MPKHNFLKAALVTLVTLISYAVISEELLKSGAEIDHAELVQAQSSTSTQQLPVIWGSSVCLELDSKHC